MKQNVIVLSARGWALTDEKTGQERSGVSIHYIMTDNLEPFKVENTGEEGYQPVKQSISLDEAKHLENVPGVYEADFQMRASAGKTVLALSTLKYLCDVGGEINKKKG